MILIATVLMYRHRLKLDFHLKMIQVNVRFSGKCLITMENQLLTSNRKCDIDCAVIVR